MIVNRGTPGSLEEIVGNRYHSVMSHRSQLRRWVPQDEVSGLTITNGHTTPSEGGRAYSNGLTPQRVKANPKLAIQWKACGCVCCVVREAAVNDEMFCAGSSRSYYYFVSLRRAYNESTEAGM